MSHSIYLFLDEGGNFDFKPSGTRYFTLTSVAMRRPFDLYEPLNNLRYDCMEYGLPTEFFHCSEDNKHVRGKVFDLLVKHQSSLTIDALVVHKSCVVHHASRSHFGLQIADYCNWAIFRKWQNNDSAFYECLKPAIAAEVLLDADAQKIDPPDYSLQREPLGLLSSGGNL